MVINGSRGLVTQDGVGFVNERFVRPRVAFATRPFPLSEDRPQPRDSAGYTGAAATVHAVPFPRREVGDTLVLIFATPNGVIFTTPAGWTLISSHGGQAGGTVSRVYTRVTDNAEGSTLNFTINSAQKAAAVMFSINGCGSVTSTVAGSTGTSHDPPADTNAADLVARNTQRTVFTYAAYLDDTTTVTGYPASYLKLLDQAGDGTSTGVHLVTAWQRSGTGATPNPGAFTLSATEIGTAGTITALPTGVVVPSLLASANQFYIPTVQEPTDGGYWPTVATTAKQTGTGSSANVNLPSGVVSGNRVFGVIRWSSETAAPSLPAGWTQVYTSNVALTDTFNVTAFYRDCDGTEGSSITLTNASTVSRDWQTYLWRIENFDTASAPYAGTPVVTAIASDPNPPSVTPPWGATPKSLAFAISASTDTIDTYESFPTELKSTDQVNDANGGNIGVAYGGGRGASFDPSPFSFLGAGTDDVSVNTVLIQGAQLAGNKRPPLFTNSQTFYGPRVVRAVVSPFLSGGSQVFAPSVRRFVQPGSLLGSSNAFFTPLAVSRTVRPGSALASTNQFFTVSVRRTVRPGLLASSNGVFAPTVNTGAYIVGPAPFVASGNLFFQPTVTVTTVSVALPPVPTVGAGVWKAIEDEYRWKRPRRKKPVEWELPSADAVGEGPPFRPLVVTPEIAREAAKRQVQFARRAEEAAKARKRKASTERALDDLATNVIVRVILNGLKGE